MSADWLGKFSAAAKATDRLVGHKAHASLLAAGLMGEAGSILAELKKRVRERGAYPAYRHRLLEEIGDFLWYFVRLVDAVDEDLIGLLPRRHAKTPLPRAPQSIALSLDLGHAVGGVVGSVRSHASGERLRPPLRDVWDSLRAVASNAEVSLRDAASRNILKIESRWPRTRAYRPLFDDDYPEEDQLPRRITVEFRDRDRGRKKVMLLRCNGLNFGDQLTDNIRDPDGYRYHDVFHFAYAVHLGWSPVVRSLLRCKRKSDSDTDEAEDGRRAAILEEAVAAIVFSRAKQLRFFEGLRQLDYDLLKTVHEFITGYEVEAIPLWQWEVAILDGYRTFRQLRDNHGGIVTLDLRQHRIKYAPPRKRPRRPRCG